MEPTETPKPDAFQKLDEIIADLQSRRSIAATAACRRRDAIRAQIEELRSQIERVPEDAEWEGLAVQIANALTLRSIISADLEAAHEAGRQVNEKALDAVIDECRTLQDQCENLRESFDGIRQTAKELKDSASSAADDLLGLFRDIGTFKSDADDIEKQAGTVIQTVEEVNPPKPVTI